MDVGSVLEPLKSAGLRPLVCVAGLAVAAAGTIYLFRRLRAGRSDAEPASDKREEASPGSNGSNASDSGAELSSGCCVELSPGSHLKAAPNCSAEPAPYKTVEYARHCPVLRRRARSRQRHKAQATLPPAASHEQPVSVPWSVLHAAPRTCSPAASLDFSYF